jgi:hypothetical protein
MLGMIAAAGVTAVIVHDYSRFGRESATTMAIRRDLEKRGVHVLSVSDPGCGSEHRGLHGRHHLRQE